MSIISEALQDQELAAALLRERSPFLYNEQDYALSMFDLAALAMTEYRFRRSLRDNEDKIRDFIKKHTGHFTTDLTLEGTKRLLERLQADGILCVFIVPPYPAHKQFVLARRDVTIGDRYQPGDIIATLELPRP